jgi:hypothetical protein
VAAITGCPAIGKEVGIIGGINNKSFFNKTYSKTRRVKIYTGIFLVASLYNQKIVA